jgi:hypothetical protein
MDDNTVELVRTLESEPLGGLRTAQAIFDKGRLALPILSKELTNMNDYRGACGQSARESSYLLEERDPIPEARPRPAIREISLYLIIAILEEDLYFADTCRIATGQSDVQNLTIALNAIQSLVIEESGTPTGDSLLILIRREMEQYGLRFPGDIYVRT